MELRLLDKKALREVYRRHVKRDFPLDERKPLQIMERLVADGRYDTLGAYEGEALVAYAFLWHDETEDYVLLEHLAVCAGGRGRGVGTAVLALLAGYYDKYRGILIEIEVLEDGLEEAERNRRLRRRDFYLRAGCRLLDYRARLFRVVYDMLVLGEAHTAAAIETHRRLYSATKYTLARCFVEIPYAPLD